MVAFALNKHSTCSVAFDCHDNNKLTMKSKLVCRTGCNREEIPVCWKDSLLLSWQVVLDNPLTRPDPHSSLVSHRCRRSLIWRRGVCCGNFFWNVICGVILWFLRRKESTQIYPSEWMCERQGRGKSDVTTIVSWFWQCNTYLDPFVGVTTLLVFLSQSRIVTLYPRIHSLAFLSQWRLLLMATTSLVGWPILECETNCFSESVRSMTPRSSHCNSHWADIAEYPHAILGVNRAHTLVCLWKVKKISGSCNAFQFFLCRWA